MSDALSRGIPRIGDTAPDFQAVTTQGELSFHRWKEGKWTLLFSHPADFTPVCSTEIAELARRADEFAQLDTRLLGLSIDSIHSHMAWRENLRWILGVSVPFPLIADIDMRVARLYGMLHEQASATATVRAVFVIDPKHVVRALVYYPLNVGRNVDELLRLVLALQTADRNSVACPVNWKPGDKVIVPPPKSESELAERDTHTDYEKLDFYLRRRSL